MEEVHRSLKYIAYIVFFIASVPSGFAEDSLKVGNAVMYKDPRIDYLQKVYSEKNKIQAKATALYRVQVVQSRSRSEVNEIRSYLSSKYPEMPLFLSFSPPTFRLRVGNFISRDNAQVFLEEVRRKYPASFIVEN